MAIKKENRELRDKIMAGIKKAVKKLIETSAANDENLIIEDEDGKVKSVPAKELLGSH